MKGLLKNRGLLVGAFVSFCLLFYFIGFSGIPFTISDTTYCGSTVTSISNTDYQLNDASWGEVWLAVVRVGLGCDVTTATIDGSQFVDGSFVGAKPVQISMNIEKQGCRGLIQKGTGGDLGGEYLRTLKRLAILDTAIVSDSFTINNAKIGAEKTCLSTLKSQGNNYFIAYHYNDCSIFPFSFCTLSTECYGFQKSDLNLLGTISDNDRSVFYSVKMRLSGVNDSGDLYFNEGRSYNRFSSGEATLVDVGRGVELCPTFKDSIGLLKPPTFWEGSQWKLIDKGRVDYARNLLIAMPGNQISSTGIDQTINLVNKFNSAVEGAISSTVALTLSNQIPIGYLGDRTQFDVFKSDVVRPEVRLKLDADWVGLRSFAGIPSIGSINSVEGVTDRKIPVSVTVKNTGGFDGSFSIKNDCSGGVTPTELFRGLSPGKSTIIVFYNSFASVGCRICHIEMTDLNGGGTDRKAYSVCVTRDCTLTDVGNWVVNQDTCSLQCGLTGCEPGFYLNSLACACVSEDLPPQPQDCGLIDGSYFDVALNRCVCPVGEKVTVGVAGALSCESVALEVCPEGQKLNEAGDGCVPKEFNLLSVFGFVLIVGGIVFIALNFWFGGKGKGLKPKGIAKRILRG